MSTTRTPASGGGGGPLACGTSRRRGSTRPACSPRRGAGRAGGGRRPSISYGGRGCSNAPDGSAHVDAARHQVLVAPHRVAVVHRRHGDAQRRGALHELRRRVPRRVGVHDRVPLVEAPAAPECQGQLLVAEQVGPLDEEQEIPELLPGVGVEADPSVGGRLDRRRLQGARRRRQRRPAEEAVEEIEEGAAAERDRLEQGDVDMLAVPGAPSAPHRRQSADGREGAPEPLRDAAARLEGLAFGAAANADGAGLRLQGELRPRPVRPRSAAPEGRDRQQRQRRESLRQLRLLDAAGREALHDQIGAGDQRRDRGVLRSADHGALRRVEELEEGAVAAAQIGTGRRPAAQRIAVRALDLDHVGAGVGEQLRAVGTGDLGGEVDYPDVAQAVHLEPSSNLAGAPLSKARVPPPAPRPPLAFAGRQHAMVRCASEIVWIEGHLRTALRIDPPCRRRLFRRSSRGTRDSRLRPT